jgi:hypothetical protein
MRICDRCKNLKAKCFEVHNRVSKVEEKKGRSSEREIVDIPLDLCDPCLTEWNKEVGYLITRIRAADAVAGGNGDDGEAAEEPDGV